MKSFHSLVVLKRPQHELWIIMRDHLAHFAANIGDIAGVRQIERTEEPDGTVRIANEWRLRQEATSMIRSMLRIDELTWIDRNFWTEASGACPWTIEPSVLPEYISCAGETSFSPAMGGRGTRVTIAGEFDLKPGLFDPGLTNVVESVVSTIVAKNLRAVAEAAAQFSLPEPNA